MADAAEAESFKALEELVDRLLSAEGHVEAAARSVRAVLETVPGIDAASIPESVFLARELMARESDRGCALIAVAFLETELETLLRDFFLDDVKEASALLEGTGGLATFSARISMAYLLGLISKPAARDLHLIRKIRNDFAHSPNAVTFDAEDVRNRCRELYHDGFAEELPPRKKFMRVVCGVTACIHAGGLNNERRAPPSDLDLESDESKARWQELHAQLQDQPAPDARPEPRTDSTGDAL